MRPYDMIRDDDLKVAFVHIPKTGGNTFRDYLRRSLVPRAELVLNNDAAIARFASLSPVQKLGFDLVSGHMPFGFDPALPRRFRYFTFLRHPVDRVVSNYNYMMGGEPQNAIARRLRDESWSFHDFVTTRDPMVMGRLFAHLAFLGQPERADRPVGLGELASLAARRVVADFDFVGCLELYDECLVYLHERHGFPLERYEKKNTTKKKHKRRISEADLTTATERLGHEIELYEVARAALERRLSRVEDLGAKVAALRTDRAAA